MKWRQKHQRQYKWPIEDEQKGFQKSPAKKHCHFGPKFWQFRGRFAFKRREQTTAMSNAKGTLTSRGEELSNKPPSRTRAICRCQHLVRRHHVSALLTDQWGQQVRLPYGFRWSEAFSRHILRRGRPPEGGMRWKRWGYCPVSHQDENAKNIHPWVKHEHVENEILCDEHSYNKINIREWWKMSICESTVKHEELRQLHYFIKIKD